MRAPLRRTIGLALPLFLGAYAACSGDAFEVGGAGGGAQAASSSAGTGGAATTSTASAGGDATSSVSSATGMGGAGTGSVTSATSAQSSGVGGAGGEAVSSSAGPGPSSATGAGGGPPLSWCQANGQLHYFCADFDSGDLLAGWDDFVFEPGLTGTPETMLATSPPVSLKVVGGVDTADSWGVLSKDYAAGATHTFVEVDIRHTGAAFAAEDLGDISLITLSHDGGTAGFGVSASGFFARYQSTVSATLPMPSLDSNKWVRVGLDVTYSQFVQGGQVSVSYDGVVVGKIGNIQTLEDPQAVGMTLYLGQLRQGSTPPFVAFFDDATWDVD